MPGPDDVELMPDEEIEIEDGTEGQDDAHEDPTGELEQEEDDGDAAQADGAEPDAVAANPSRAEGRIQRLAREAKEAREEVARERQARQDLENRLSRLEKPAVQEKEPTPEEMALWAPEQIIDYKLGKATGRFEQRLAQMQFQTAEAADKASFDAQCARDPVAARHAAEVEKRLTALRQQGQNVGRDQLLTYVIGEKIRQRGPKAKAKQAQDGQRRIKRETVDPASARGDAATPRRGGEKSLEDRLANVTF